MLQQIPRAVTACPPSEPTVPPDAAVIAVIELAAVVAVTFGIVYASVVNVVW
ncbi:hypothetical protein D3C85_1923240 [compost metagenome]